LNLAAIAFASPVVGWAAADVALLPRRMVEVPRQSEVLVGRLGAVVLVVVAAAVSREADSEGDVEPACGENEGREQPPIAAAKAKATSATARNRVRRGQEARFIGRLYQRLRGIIGGDR